MVIQWDPVHDPGNTISYGDHPEWTQSPNDHLPLSSYLSGFVLLGKKSFTKTMI